jgi:hypothetical protein
MLRMVFTQIGLIIGERTKGDPEMLALKDPRLLLPVQNQPGKFQIADLLGHPKGFQIDEKTMNWDVSDESLIASYKESTTGLTLAKVPANFNLSNLKVMN